MRKKLLMVLLSLCGYVTILTCGQKNVAFSAPVPKDLLPPANCINYSCVVDKTFIGFFRCTAEPVALIGNWELGVIVGNNEFQAQPQIFGTFTTPAPESVTYKFAAKLRSADVTSLDLENWIAIRKRTLSTSECPGQDCAAFTALGIDHFPVKDFAGEPGAHESVRPILCKAKKLKLD